MDDLKHIYVDEQFPVAVEILFKTIAGDDSDFMVSQLEKQKA